MVRRLIEKLEISKLLVNYFEIRFQMSLILRYKGKKMKYYLQENFIQNADIKNAGNKARNDVNKILQLEGYQPLYLQSENWHQMSLLQAQVYKYKLLKQTFSQITEGDCLVIQFPMIHHSLLFASLIKFVQKKGGRVFLLIHDLEQLRTFRDRNTALRHKIRIKVLESKPLDLVDGIIAHNDMMKSVLVNKGISSNKIVSLRIFDYLIPNFKKPECLKKDSPIIIAGNLSFKKAGYIYNLPTSPAYHLYGVGFDETQKLPNETYFGSFLPDDLPSVLRGSFGLVWDGDSAETCSGVFGNYLKYNNSHKASLYLAAGFPVIVWNRSALSQFILKNNCGIAVESLQELNKVLAELTEAEYESMIKNVSEVGRKIRDGYFLKTALKCLIK